jgi:fructose-1,6-bisphosphatase/inositol monophosphatase family enzyme
LEIAYVAIGRVDAFVEPYLQLRSFDCLPSLFLVERAGGYLHFIGQEPTRVDLLQPERYAFVAAGTRALLHEILRGLDGGSS